MAPRPGFEPGIPKEPAVLDEEEKTSKILRFFVAQGRRNTGLCDRGIKIAFFMRDSIPGNLFFP